MSIKQILARELPEISDSIKNMVNQGIWHLYKIDDSASTYMLKSTETSYFLDKKGFIIKMESTRTDNVKIDGSVYFSDLPFPPLVNSFMSA
jgi:hypothetical protein